MSRKNPYILKWTHEDMLLSGGSKQKVFLDHNEAMSALEDEIGKVQLPIARNVIRMGVDTHEYHRIAELEVVRNEARGLMLYGVSEYYLRPKICK